MSDVDFSKIKPGDTLTIKVEVVGYPHSQHGTLPARAAHGSGILWVQREDIVTHNPKPKPFEVGDRVRRPLGFDTFSASIVHIIDGEAWVRYDDDSSGVYKLADLEHV